MKLNFHSEILINDIWQHYNTHTFKNNDMFNHILGMKNTQFNHLEDIDIIDKKFLPTDISLVTAVDYNSNDLNVIFTSVLYYDAIQKLFILLNKYKLFTKDIQEGFGFLYGWPWSSFNKNVTQNNHILNYVENIRFLYWFSK